MTSSFSIGVGTVIGIGFQAMGWSIVGGPFALAVVLGIGAALTLDYLDE